MAPITFSSNERSGSGILWIQALPVDTMVNNMVGTAGQAISSTTSRPAVPWIQALTVNMTADNTPDTSPLSRTSASISGLAEESSKGEMMRLMVSLMIPLILYVILALIFGVIATYWHRGLRQGQKRPFFCFPVYFIIGLLVIPLMAVLGVVQVIVLTILSVSKCVTGGREVKRMDWLFKLPPLWMPSGVFQQKMCDKKGYVLPLHSSPVRAAAAGFSAQAVTGGSTAPGGQRPRPGLKPQARQELHQVFDGGAADGQQELAIPTTARLTKAGYAYTL